VKTKATVVMMAGGKSIFSKLNIC